MDTMLSYYAITLQKVYKFALLQILWLAFTILGLGVFGIFPATHALFTVLNETEELSSKNTYIHFRTVYMSSFIKINKAGLIWQAMTLLMGMNLFILTGERLNLELIIIGMLGLIMLSIIHFFCHFEQEQSIFKQIKRCFGYVCLNPKQNLAYMAIIFLLFLGINFSPGITFFFGISVAAHFIVKTWNFK